MNVNLNYEHLDDDEYDARWLEYLERASVRAAERGDMNLSYYLWSMWRKVAARKREQEYARQVAQN